MIYRYKTRRNSRRMTGRRRNPGGESTSSLIQQSIFGAAGAVGSRMLPQIVLGSNNTGIMGYGANIVSGLILAWGGRKFFGRSAGNAALAGAGIALVLRLIQDFTPWGSTVSLNGMGDAGMGILMPSQFVDPAIFTGVGAERRIPPAWRPIQPAAPGMGMRGISSTYANSTYGR